MTGTTLQLPDSEFESHSHHAAGALLTHSATGQRWASATLSAGIRDLETSHTSNYESYLQLLSKTAIWPCQCLPIPDGLDLAKSKAPFLGLS